VLIGGKGHQYHDGHEGTNSSWAWARVRDYRTGLGWMTVTSDATEAYQIVLPEVKRVLRTLVFLKPDVLIVLDRVSLTGTPQAVQARFQVFNDDGGGQVTATGSGFTIERPGSSLVASAAGRGNIAVRAAKLALPADDTVHPYAEVESAPALAHEFITVSTAAPKGSKPAALGIERTADGWKIGGAHAGRMIQAVLVTTGEAPVITV
jgi:hypothetical protein